MQLRFRTARFGHRPVRHINLGCRPLRVGIEFGVILTWLRRTRVLVGQVFVVVTIIVMLVWLVFPLWWSAMTSIKPGGDVYGNALVPFLQFEPTLNHWQYVLDLDRFRESFSNSVIIGFGGATIALALGIPAAYALARSGPGISLELGIAWWLIVVRALPPVVFGPPIYLLARDAGLLDTIAAQTVVSATFGLVFVVVIMDAMFRTVPIDLEHAAQVDGASGWQVLLNIVLPLVTPGVVSAWLIAFAFAWNELFFGLILADQDALPLTVVMLSRGGNHHATSAIALVMLVPPLIIALASQRFLVHGLSLGAVRG